MEKVSEDFGKFFIKMWIGDDEEGELDHLESPSGSGHHYIEIIPGVTYSFDVKVGGKMPQKPLIVSFQGGTHSWEDTIESICDGCPDTASREIKVISSGRENRIRIQCSSISTLNHWGNNWESIVPNKTLECTFGVK